MEQIRAISVALVPNGLSQTIPIHFSVPEPVNLDLRAANPLPVQLVQANPPLVLKTLNTIGEPKASLRTKVDEPSQTGLGAAQSVTVRGWMD